MELSHEVPKCLLNMSRTFNDYDYALVHLFEEDKDYFNFYKESMDMGRRVILDNSIFELGEAFDFEKYSEWIGELRPTEYILPDSLQNLDITKINAKKFLTTFGRRHIRQKSIGVVQGKTYDEIVDCYKFYVDNNVYKIAIGFNLPFYLESDGGTDDIKYMNGRIQLLEKMIENGVIDYSKPHHLLGCALPQEFIHYRDDSHKFRFIDTIDTSSPIVHALERIRFGKYGIEKKCKTKLVEYFNVGMDEVDTEVLMYNVNIFNGFVKEK